MKHIKLFEGFSGTKNISEMYYGGKYDFIGAYDCNEFDEFVDAVEFWEKITGSSCKWSLYPGDQHVNHKVYTTGNTPTGCSSREYWEMVGRLTGKNTYQEAKNLAKPYWNMYIKPGKRMVLVEGDVFLFGVVVGTNGDIEYCMGSNDHPVRDEIVLKRIEDTIYENI